MNKEFESRLPDLRRFDPDLALFIKSNAMRVNGGEIPIEEIQQMSNIVEAAKKVGPVIRKLKENLSLDGFALAISKNDILYPTLLVEIGKVEEKQFQEANLKLLFIKDHPESNSSIQNLSLPEEEKMYSNSKSVVDGGALLFKDGWIISISGLASSQMDTVFALVTAIGSNLIGFDEAITRVRDEGAECLDLFVKYKDRLTEPFFSEINDRDEIPEEPHSKI